MNKLNYTLVFVVLLSPLSYALTDKQLAQNYAPILLLSKGSYVDLKVQNPDYPYTDYTPINIEKLPLAYISLKAKENLIWQGVNYQAEDQIPLDNFNNLGDPILKQSTDLDFSQIALELPVTENVDILAYTLRVDAKPTVYFKVTKEQTKFYPIAIQYWFFYFHNEWAGIHRGDWESITLFLDNNENIQEAVYSTHFEATRYSIQTLTAEPCFQQNKKPCVYISNGGHGSYAISGKTLYAAGLVDEHRGDAEQLKDYDLIDLAPIAENKTSWLWFEGLWGDNTKAPQGPLFREDIPTLNNWIVANNQPKDHLCERRLNTLIYQDPWYWGSGYNLDNRYDTCSNITIPPCQSTYTTTTPAELKIPVAEINGVNAQYQLAFEQIGDDFTFKLKKLELLTQLTTPDARYDALAEILNLAAVVIPSAKTAYKVRLLRKDDLFTVLTETIALQPVCVF